MRTLPFLALAASLWAQDMPGVGEGFFAQDPKTFMAACADKARVLSPSDSRFLARWGQVYLAAGQRDRAEDAFRRAAKIGAKDPGTHALLALAWLKNGFPKEACAALEAMPKETDRAREWLIKVALPFMASGLEKEAADCMEKAYRFDPRDWRSFVDFGRTAVKANRRELAMVWFQRAVKTKPRDEEVWTSIALASAGSE